MRWAALWLGGLTACGPAVIVGGGETNTDGDESTTGTSTTTVPGTSSTGVPMTTSTTTSPGTTTATDTDVSSTTDDPPPPDVPEFDCFDDDCGEGQWCGSSHMACEPIPEITECAGEPTHHVLQVDGVVGSLVDVLVADVDGDTDDDAIVLSADAVTVVLQDGGLAPLAPQALAIASPLFVQLGQIDGDGVWDLSVATASTIYWAPGMGDGTFGGLEEMLAFGGIDVGGLGIGPAGDEGEAQDVVAFVPEAAMLVLGLSDGAGTFADVMETELEVETPGPFVAIDRGFSTLMATVGSIDLVYSYAPDPETFEFTYATEARITNAGLPVVDVDLVRKGGGVFTYGFVNLGTWTLGGILSQLRGIATPSRLVVGNGLAGFDYAYVTEDDRVLLVSDCYDAYDLGTAPVAADAGDLDGDGSGDLAMAMDGVPLSILLSGAE